MNPHDGHECSRTHNGLSVSTPHAAHSLVVPAGSTATKCVPSRSHLYSSIRRNVPHAAPARLRLFDGISNYSRHGQLVLWALTILEEEEKTPVRTRDIREPYEILCDSEGSNPVSDRAVREYLAELETLGIISSTQINRGKGGGKYKEHELDQSISSVKAGLKELLGATP